MPEVNPPEAGAPASVPFDLRQSGQVPQTQLDAVRALHETFLGNLCESLSLLLRTEVTGTLAGVEQVPFSVLAESIGTPACLVYFTMQPHEGNALVEVTQPLIAPILDCVLGGSGKIDFALDREITDIEQAMLDGFFATLGQELREAWKAVAGLEFAFSGVETTPQNTRGFDPADSVILVAADMRIGDKEGRLHLAIPSLIVKVLRQKFEPQPETRKSGSPELEQAIQEKLAAGLKLRLDCTLLGSTIRLRDLLKLKPGDVIDTGIACDDVVTIMVNGLPKFCGEVTVEGPKQSVVIQAGAQPANASAI